MPVFPNSKSRFKAYFNIDFLYIKRYRAPNENTTLARNNLNYFIGTISIFINFKVESIEMYWGKCSLLN